MSKADQGKLQNKLDLAIRHHSTGGLQKARQLYHKVLKTDSGYNDAAIRLLNKALNLYDELITGDITA